MQAKAIQLDLDWSGLRDAVRNLIAPPKHNRRIRVDWDRMPLGKTGDRLIAKAFGISAVAVRNARVARGIPVAEDPEAPLTTAAVQRAFECDCGQPRPVDREACDRCERLDGLRLPAPAQAVISALRIAGRSTLDALCLELPGYTRRSIYRGISALLTAGRAKRTEVREGWFTDVEFELVEAA